MKEAIIQYNDDPDADGNHMVISWKEIVRCMDCKYRSYYCTEATDGTALYNCHHPCANSVPRPGNWFCADGKRQDS
jgi:hypothetical protein